MIKQFSIILRQSQGKFSIQKKQFKSFYNIQRPFQAVGKKELLYQSNISKEYEKIDQNLQTSDYASIIHQNSFLRQKYLNLVPFFYEASTSHPKQFVIKMSAQNNCLELQCFTQNAIFNKLVNMENIIPVCHEDYRRNLLEAPHFIDNEMIYYNTFLQEFYVFDAEGQWVNFQNKINEAISNPNLSLNARFNEKKWFDVIRTV